MFQEINYQLVRISEILAICHFNKNLQRGTIQTKQGKDFYQVVYRKFKHGEGMIRNIPVPATYGIHWFTFSLFTFLPSITFAISANFFYFLLCKN